MQIDDAIIKPNNGAIKSAVILLHGLGSDGHNMIGLGDVLQEKLPNTVFIAPNAPFGFDMAPMGFQWFSLYDWSPKAMLEGAQRAAPLLNTFIDDVLREFSLQPEKLALAGFSQGCMMALHVGVRRKKKLAGIVGMSGALLAPELLSETQSKPDICLTHGALDMVVPFPALQMASAALKTAGFDVETHTRPYLDHSIDMETLENVGKFLKHRL